MTHRPFSPTGWSWLCPCGWSTGRGLALEQIARSREGHIRLHDASADLKQAVS